MVAAISGDARLPRVMIVPPVLPEGLSADLHTIRAHDAARAPLFCTKDFIIDACPVRPPERDPALLVLTAADLSRTQPRRSSLYLVDLAPPYTSRRLSPEEHYNFWDISVGDVDGDGAQDVALCTFSRTALTPRYARRFFIYSFDEHGDLYPRWRGSRLPVAAVLDLDVLGIGKAALYGQSSGAVLSLTNRQRMDFAVLDLMAQNPPEGDSEPPYSQRREAVCAGIADQADLYGGGYDRSMTLVREFSAASMQELAVIQAEPYLCNSDWDYRVAGHHGFQLAIQDESPTNVVVPDALTGRIQLLQWVSLVEVDHG